MPRDTRCRKLSPVIVNSTHLTREPTKVQKDFAPTLNLPEDLTDGIWHSYKYLTVTPVNHYDTLIVLIKEPLADTDSSMTFYDVYNLPIFN